MRQVVDAVVVLRAKRVVGIAGCVGVRSGIGKRRWDR